MDMKSLSDHQLHELIDYFRKLLKNRHRELIGRKIAYKGVPEIQMKTADAVNTLRKLKAERNFRKTGDKAKAF